MKNPIPFQNLTGDMAHLREEIEQAIHKVIESGEFIHGSELELFEYEFAAYNGTADVVGVASGLAALELMLLAYDIGPGDEVIVPGNTYIATWLAVSHVGAKPVPVEPDYQTRNIDPSALKAALTKRTKAVLAVHLYGVPCAMDALESFCQENNVFLLVDAAQSCGATWKGKRSKCLGDAAAFSFYPTKNLGAFGDAGAVTTNDHDRAERIRLLRNYGMRDRYHHLYKGYNAKLEEIHAAVLRIKLKHLDEALEKRNRLVKTYRKTFNDNMRISMQKIPATASPAWHLFTLAIPCRDKVIASLRNIGIQTLVHYPVPPHLSLAYINEKGGWPNLPITERLSQTLISLPLFPSMEPGTAEHVSTSLNSIINSLDPSEGVFD